MSAAAPPSGATLSVLMALDYDGPYVSGLSATADRLAEALAARGHAVAILTHRHRAALPAEETRRGVRVLRSPVLATLGKAQFSPRLLSTARRELAGADVLHLHAPLVPAVPLALLARTKRVPIVTTYHCDLKLPSGFANNFLEAAARLSQDFALARSDVIVQSTEDYARATPSLARRLDRLVPIPPPIPSLARLTGSPAAPDLLRERWGIRGAPVVLFVGRFAEEKGLFDLVAALPILRERFPGAVLVLAGEHREVPGEDVGRRLAPLLADRSSGVVATGHVADAEMPALFSLADVLALPSTNSTESFGIVQVEAMQAGVPVVASNLPGVREPIRRTGMGELAQPGDPASLAAALRRVLESPDLYRSRAPEARSAFSFDRSVELYEEAYRRAIDRSKARRRSSGTF